jgi:hypothetical protein
MRVPEDDNVGAEMEGGQATGDTMVEACFVGAADCGQGEIPPFIEKTPQAGMTTVDHDYATSRQAELELAGQRGTPAREVQYVNIPSDSMDGRDFTQRCQGLRSVDIPGVQDHVHSSQGIEDRWRQVLYSVREVGVGEKADNERNSSVAVP